MARPNPKCDPDHGGCKHPWSFHGNSRGRCRAMGCTCQRFVGRMPKIDPPEKKPKARVA